MEIGSASDRKYSIFVGNQNGRNQADNRRVQEEQENEKKQGSTLFAGNLNITQDTIFAKKQKAQKEALKGVLEQFVSDKKMDDGIEEQKNRIIELESNISNIREEIKQIDTAKEALRNEYGVDIDSQEQKDLEILEKQRRNSVLGIRSTEDMLTQEEWDRLQNMEPLTDYQKLALDVGSKRDTLEKEDMDLQKEILGTSASIEYTKQELLKSDPMVKQQKLADKILEASSKEIIGALIDEAKEHIEEEQKEKEEKEEIKKEELEKQEELTKKEEVKTSDSKNEIQKIAKSETEKEKLLTEMKGIIEEGKLLQEDLKGIAIDTII